MAASQACEARLKSVAEAMRERELDALVVSAPANVRYLTRFTGSNGLALVLASRALLGSAAPGRAAATDRQEPAGIFFTDFRYETQAQHEVPGCFERWPIDPSARPADLAIRVAECLGANAPDEPGGASAERAGRRSDAQDSAQRAQARADLDPGPGPGRTGQQAGGGRLGFDESHLTVARHTRLAELLDGRWELVGAAGLVESLREVKDADELKRIAAAAELADEALRAVLETGLAGRSERELAIELELRMRRLGGEAAFPTIVAAGAHGALPHATPRDARIPPRVLVTVDWGALHDGYCSDCTRTFASGPVGERAQEIYALVLHAQEAALGALAAGRTGVEIDAVARELIAAAGYGERFGHGLGHGVGLEVHEGPRLSPAAGEDPLRAGNVVTVEPGVYLPGELGVRIEDLAVIDDSGARVLSTLPKALTVIG
jgi:Xaa-Pro aminopeptidase